MKISIFWFRRDLRLEDNTALNRALSEKLQVLPVFIFDEEILHELPNNDPRVNFIYNSLNKIDQTLKKHNSSLLCLRGKPIEIWKNLLKKFQIESVFVNKDYEPYARHRDQKIKQLLDKHGISFISIKDQVIHEENEILKNDNKPYTVFTPYKRKWLELYEAKPYTNKVDFNNFYSKIRVFPSMEELGIKKSDISVKDFDLSKIDHYEQIRDYPHIDQTSYLSPHLRFGTISIREILSKLKPSNSVFQSELIWREFFMQILYHFPHVVTENFKPKYNAIKWLNNSTDFEKWCTGKTGYPIVDAGMRQLNKTGYMHNRVRMITAGFLCKHLLIDWRLGEAYFAKKLLDYELSSNNGNWQWAAGTGCDAAPYFRIFNPYEQQKKFDKNQDYIKKWVSEINTDQYPKPMVEHKFARNRALEAYKIGINKY